MSTMRTNTKTVVFAPTIQVIRTFIKIVLHNDNDLFFPVSTLTTNTKTVNFYKCPQKSLHYIYL